MAAPRKKPPVKKPPVKKAPVKKKPSFLRKDTPRPARDIKPGDLRSQALDKGKPQAAKDLKAGDMRSQSLKGPSTKAGIVKGLAKKIPVVGAAIGFITDAAPAGAGSDRPSGPLMKSNMPGGYGSKTSGYGPTPKKKASVSSMLGSGRPEYPSTNKGKKTSGNKLGVGGPGGARALENVKGKKSGSSKASSVAPAKASSGTSKAATTNVSKTKRRSPTRYQRDETAMEQKFRKG